MAMKVSDEYTVPLCVGHHEWLHRTGDERAWWAARGIDPLAVALQLWTAPERTTELPAMSANVSGSAGAKDSDRARASPASGRDKVDFVREMRGKNRKRPQHG